MSKKPTSSNKKEVLSQQVQDKEELKQMKKMYSLYYTLRDVTYLKEEIHSLHDQLRHLYILYNSLESIRRYPLKSKWKIGLNNMYVFRDADESHI
jgi:hypothetical protein